MATATVQPASTARAPRRAIKSGRERLFLALLVLSAMLLMCAPFFVDLVDRAAPKAQGGTVSYAGWGALDAPVQLDGEWRLVWRGGPSGEPAVGTSAPIAMPGEWDATVGPDGRPFPGTGMASYVLVIRDLPPGVYTLYVPVIFGATRTLVDGRVIAEAGRVSADPSRARTEVRSITAPIESRGEPFELRIDLAAHHHRDTGFTDSPLLALAAPMQIWIALEWTKDLLFQTSLLLLAANAFIAFVFRREDRASLFLALAALCSVAPTAAVAHDNLLLIAFPSLDFTGMLGIQYLLSIAALMFFFAYANALFPEDSSQRVYKALQIATGVFLALQTSAIVLQDTMQASLYAMYWPFVSGATVFGIIAVVLRATLRGRDGSIVFLLGIGVFAIAFFNSALIWADMVPARFGFGSSALSLGMLVLLFSHFIVMAERWTLAIVHGERTNRDLRELIDVNAAITSEIQLEKLLARIVEATSHILGADRSSLLLHDKKTGELWSLVAEGMATREIRLPADQGLAGYAFTHNAIVNVPDAHDDARFNRAFDDATGYRTRSLLTMPIVARDGRKLGVMQALNRRDGEAFDAGDEQRMAAFAAQAAIAIDNASLFSEVVAQRNYSESILRSMSSGVVTLDRDLETAKINEAAARILALPPETVERRDAREFIAAGNPTVLSELDQVNETGRSKSLLDIDVMTGTGEAISANIQIVPMKGEDGPTGLLLLIDNISEGKRLQGAMRRFMTQEVMDQVLARRDDSLFGSAVPASVLFADIRGFTSIAEGLTARETVEMLNEAFTEFYEAVSASSGVLDKYIGDAVMAVFGAPLSTGRDAANAVDAGVAMLRALDRVNDARERRDQRALKLGIGIATGEVIAGTIGSPKRMDYTVIGDSVNLAARLQDLSKTYGVEMIVCEQTAGAVCEGQAMRELDLIRVRGRATPSKIFELFPRAPADPAALDALLAAYACGRAALLAGEWGQAIEAFERALAIRADDRPSRIMLERARALLGAPPGEDWDGVWVSPPKIAA